MVATIWDIESEKRTGVHIFQKLLNPCCDIRTLSECSYFNAPGKQAVEETLGHGQVALDVEADDAAEAGHLSLGDVVVGVALEPGIVDAPHVGVALEEARHAHRRGVVDVHAQAEGLEATQQQIAAMGVENPAHGLVQLADLVDQLGSAQDGAGQDVVVATQVPNVPEELPFGVALVLIGMVLVMNSISIAFRMYLRGKKKW